MIRSVKSSCNLFFSRLEPPSGFNVTFKKRLHNFLTRFFMHIQLISNAFLKASKNDGDRLKFPNLLRSYVFSGLFWGRGVFPDLVNVGQ